MSLIGRDSTNPFAIPADTPVVMGYGDGRYIWSSQGWDRFSGAKLVVVCFAGSSGDILDVEQGCSDPSEVPGWVDRFNRPARRRPTIYVNRSNWGIVSGLLGSRVVDWWVSTLDGGLVTGHNVVAVQNCGAAGSGDPCQTAGDYDQSVILDPSWVGGGVPLAIAQHVQTQHPITGRILPGAVWLNWGDAVGGVDNPVSGAPPPPVGQLVQFHEAVEYSDNTWRDRIDTASGPGDWALDDRFVDTLDVLGCGDPLACQKLVDTSGPPPPPPGPVLDPRVDQLLIDVAALKSRSHAHGATVQVAGPVGGPGA